MAYRVYETNCQRSCTRKYQRINQAGPAFAQAIKNVDMGHIHEGVRKFKDKVASEAQVIADINLLKQRTANATVANVNLPTKAIQTQLASTAISQQPVS
jgi:hypothetical protein